MRPIGRYPTINRPCFNEAAGADPADAFSRRPVSGSLAGFNEAAGADPADAMVAAAAAATAPLLQ